MSIVAAYAAPHPPLLIPEVGKGQERKVSITAEAFERMAKEIAEIKPETIVFITPHSVIYADYFHISPSKSATGSLRQFGAPDVSMTVSYDEEFVEAMCLEAESSGIGAGKLGEKDRSLDHGMMVPLYYIQKHYTDFKAVRLTISGQESFRHYELGELVARVAKKLGKKTVFVASGDLSHKLLADGPYGFALEGPEFDAVVLDAFKTAEFDKLLVISEVFAEKAAECGLKSFIAMAGVLHKKSVISNVFSYEGTFGVGYAIASFMVTGDDENGDFLEKAKRRQLSELNEKKAHEDVYVSFARYVVENYIESGKVPEMPANLPKEMLTERAGVFVSIKKVNNLRGCVGTIMPVRENVAHEILANAVSSAVGDSRFLPVTEDELPLLTYSVDVLMQLEPVTSIEMLDVKKYGIVVRNKFKKGLLLPNLDGVDTIVQQVMIAKQKAGIGDGEDYILERFEVVRHI